MGAPADIWARAHRRWRWRFCSACWSCGRAGHRKGRYWPACRRLLPGRPARRPPARAQAATGTGTAPCCSRLAPAQALRLELPPPVRLPAQLLELMLALAQPLAPQQSLGQLQGLRWELRQPRAPEPQQAQRREPGTGAGTASGAKAAAGAIAGAALGANTASGAKAAAGATAGAAIGADTASGARAAAGAQPRAPGLARKRLLAPGQALARWRKTRAGWAQSSPLSPTMPKEQAVPLLMYTLHSRERPC